MAFFLAAAAVPFFFSEFADERKKNDKKKITTFFAQKGKKDNAPLDDAASAPGVPSLSRETATVRPQKKQQQHQLQNPALVAFSCYERGLFERETKRRRQWPSSSTTTDRRLGLEEESQPDKARFRLPRARALQHVRPV